MRGDRGRQRRIDLLDHTTTANSIAPGAAVNGGRAIYEIQNVGVFGGGADGVASTADDNTLFETQGVFVP